MKIKVEVDLGDMFAEWSEDESLSFKEEIEALFVQRLKDETFQEVRKRLNPQFMSKTIEVLNTKIEEYADATIKDFLDTKELIQPYYNESKPMTFKEYIEKRTTNYHVDYYRKIDEATKIYISKEMDKIVQELRDRYDMQFASQLIGKMKEAGYLKPEVVQALLPKS